MKQQQTKKFAEENFEKMNEPERGWNLIHVKYMIKALEELCEGRDDVDLEKLKTLAWVHDIGKIEGDENHAELSVGILEKEFELDTGQKSNHTFQGVASSRLDFSPVSPNPKHKLKGFGDEIDRDCIINHGSNGKPKSEEAKVFQTADGISLFYPETLLFRFWAEGKEGTGFEDMKEKMKGYYEKYLKVYADRPEAVKILKGKFGGFVVGVRKVKRD